MSKFTSKFPKMVARIVFATAFGVATLGGAAYADETDARRHEQEMSKGKDHGTAWDATSRAREVVDSPAAVARAKVHADVMATGKDHGTAWDASSRATAPGTSQRLIAKSRKHIAEMNNGKDHYAALDAARAE